MTGSPCFVGGRSNRAGQESGGVGLNENTTRLVVCVFPCSYRHLVAILFLPIRGSTFCSGLF